MNKEEKLGNIDVMKNQDMQTTLILIKEYQNKARKVQCWLLLPRAMTNLTRTECFEDSFYLTCSYYISMIGIWSK